MIQLDFQSRKKSDSDRQCC